jgi:hypothetical protein
VAERVAQYSEKIHTYSAYTRGGYAQLGVKY